MKTLIINGSPKRDGDTAALVSAFACALTGEVKILSAANNISPCTDCRACWSKRGCTLEDEMQEVYPFLEACDNIVLASPVWFSSLSGPLLNIASRMQTLYAARRFRNELQKAKPKNGVLLLVGAGRGTEMAAAQNARTILKWMGARLPCVAEVYSLDTNHIPAARDEAACENARDAARLLNEESGSQR